MNLGRIGEISPDDDFMVAVIGRAGMLLVAARVRPDELAIIEGRAADALRALGMEHLQAVVVKHTDRPHKHVHVIVNLAIPTTGECLDGISAQTQCHEIPTRVRD